jgi:hypothetical protein
MLAARGFFVVGLDSRGYLESFSSATTALTPGDVAGDFSDADGLREPRIRATTSAGGNI